MRWKQHSLTWSVTCCTLVHCVASSCLPAQVRWIISSHSAPKCVKTSVQGADPGTSRDAGAVQRTYLFDRFKGRLSFHQKWWGVILSGWICQIKQIFLQETWQYFAFCLFILSSQGTTLVFSLCLDCLTAGMLLLPASANFNLLPDMPIGPKDKRRKACVSKIFTTLCAFTFQYCLLKYTQYVCPI